MHELAPIMAGTLVITDALLLSLMFIINVKHRGRVGLDMATLQYMVLLVLSFCVVCVVKYHMGITETTVHWSITTVLATSFMFGLLMWPVLYTRRKITLWMRTPTGGFLYGLVMVGIHFLFVRGII